MNSGTFYWAEAGEAEDDDEEDDEDGEPYNPSPTAVGEEPQAVIKSISVEDVSVSLYIYWMIHGSR